MEREKKCKCPYLKGERLDTHVLCPVHGWPNLASYENGMLRIYEKLKND